MIIRQYGKFILLSVSVVLIDQITKFWVKNNLVYAKFYAILPFLNIHFIYNKGIAFSIFANSSAYVHLAILLCNIFISFVLLVFIGRLDNAKKLLKVGLCLVLGGAVGNIIDKIYLGAVIDFIDIYWKNWHFATFNVADSAISCGAILVCIDQFLKDKKAA